MQKKTTEACEAYKGKESTIKTHAERGKKARLGKGKGTKKKRGRVMVRRDFSGAKQCCNIEKKKKSRGGRRWVEE